MTETDAAAKWESACPHQWVVVTVMVMVRVRVRCPGIKGGSGDAGLGLVWVEGLPDEPEQDYSSEKRIVGP